MKKIIFIFLSLFIKIGVIFSMEYKYPNFQDYIVNGNLDKLKQILEIPENFSLFYKRYKNNNTLLHLACIYKHSSTVEYLLEKGAIIDTKNSYGETPLISLIKSGYADENEKDSFFKILKLLLGRKYLAANPNEHDDEYQNALSYAAQLTGDSLDILAVVNALLESGARFPKKERFFSIANEELSIPNTFEEEWKTLSNIQLNFIGVLNQIPYEDKPSVRLDGISLEFFLKTEYLT